MHSARCSDRLARRNRNGPKKKSIDTSRLKKGADLEVEHLTEVTDVTPKQARTLLRKHGADWQKLKDEAEDLKED
ncbi:MAG: hypothetical protein E5X67_20470 [Mesorhizobium sp.]|nr:MAG: hypothetical protein E5X67_20470 [Mesorhizobium sp.]